MDFKPLLAWNIIKRYNAKTKRVHIEQYSFHKSSKSADETGLCEWWAEINLNLKDRPVVKEMVAE